MSFAKGFLQNDGERKPTGKNKGFNIIFRFFSFSVMSGGQSLTPPGKNDIFVL